jgi:hypothetical protein
MNDKIMPEIGMGATCGVGSDAYPYTIVAVLNGGKTIEVQADNFKRTDTNGPFTEAQDYEYNRNENAPRVRFSLRKNGRYIKVGDSMNGTRISIGNRRAYRDPSF